MNKEELRAYHRVWEAENRTGTAKKRLGSKLRMRALRKVKKTKTVPKWMQVDHKKPIKSGGSNDSSNLRIISAKKNASLGAKSKKGMKYKKHK